MKRCINFIKRNIKEMLRNPLIYVFCLGFPLVMMGLFQIINNYTNGNTPMFELKALVPGIMMFSYTFVMLLMSLIVSKDKSTSFLRRLYTSPMKSWEFIFGYAIPGLVIGVLQSIIGEIAGFIISLINGSSYIPFLSCVLLIISQLPILVVCVFLGILFGTILNENSAPGICSILISASGILGGCWMPIESMGGFEKICYFLPFYPSVYLGKIITKAVNTFGKVFAYNSMLTIGLISIGFFLVLSVSLSCVLFNHQMKNN